jgi:hypothetical protein
MRLIQCFILYYYGRITPNMSQATSVTNTNATSTMPLPEGNVLVQASKLAILQDKPIQMDYYVDSVQGKAFLVIDSENKDLKVLLKSRDEYTSLITKVFKVTEDYLIVLTENSIYVVSGKIIYKKLLLSSLSQE